MHRSPLAEAAFYPFPLHWLAEINEASELDACDLLLAHTYDGKVIFADEAGEQHWLASDERARRRGLFTRQTFAKHKKLLLRRQRLRKYQRSFRTARTNAIAHRELQRGIKYEWCEWSATAPVFYRPHHYLQHRWPVWLGNSELASRAVLIALLATLRRTDNQTQVTLTWREIQAFIARHFAPRHGRNRLSSAKLRKGIQALQCVGLIEEAPGTPLRYTLSLTRFSGPPVWSLPGLAQVCRVDGAQNEHWLHLLADLLTHCCEPVTRVATVWQSLGAARTSPYLLDELDVAALRSYMQRQAQQGPLLRHEQLLADFLQLGAAHQPRLCSAAFALPLAANTVARQALAATPIQLPQPLAQPVKRLQLCLEWQRRAGLTVAAAQHILAQTRLVLWQERSGQTPVALPLLALPATLNLDMGYSVDLVDLAQTLDYAQPVEVWLKCAQPEARLTLQGRFRLWLANA
ncbi:MAG: hypothetical protein U0350_38265 [Caldilineaceae bacterium]